MKNPMNSVKKTIKNHGALIKRAGGWCRRHKLLSAAAAALFLFVLWRGLSGGETALELQTGQITRGSVQETLSISGPVSGTDSVDVVSNLHAEIESISVKEGDRVEKGQVIAVLDDTDLARQVEEAKNAYDLAVAAYDEKQREVAAGYVKASNAYAEAKSGCERSAVLFAAGDISQVEMESAERAMEDAAGELSSYTMENGRPVPPPSYRLQIESAGLALEKRQEELEDVRIQAPISGTVVRVNTKVGRFADTTEDDVPLFVIENLDVLEMKILVSEYSIGRVAVGQPAVVTADILKGRQVEGRVTDISPTGEEKGGTTERVIPTTIRILEKDTPLIAGINANARLTLDEAEDALLAPMTAVYETGDGETAVAVIRNGAVHVVLVDTGVEGDLVTEVTPKIQGDLKEGDAVILSPSPELLEGTPAAPAQQGGGHGER